MGRKDAALRPLNYAVEQNYCAYPPLQTEPLLVKLRGTPEFDKLLDFAKQCRNKFLARQYEDSNIASKNPNSEN